MGRSTFRLIKRNFFAARFRLRVVADLISYALKHFDEGIKRDLFGRAFRPEDSGPPKLIYSTRSPCNAVIVRIRVAGDRELALRQSGKLSD